MVKNLPAMQETQAWSLGWEDPLEKGIPWTKEPGELHSLWLKRDTTEWLTLSHTHITHTHICYRYDKNAHHTCGADGSLNISCQSYVLFRRHWHCTLAVEFFFSFPNYQRYWVLVTLLWIPSGCKHFWADAFIAGLRMSQVLTSQHRI